MYQLLNGFEVAKEVKQDLAYEYQQLKTTEVPHLAIVLVGHNPASETYVLNKIKACAEVGFKASLKRYPDHISEKELLQEIQAINNDPSIHGLIVQAPLPPHIHNKKVIEAIDPDKDVDGFHPTNIGKMALGLASFVPATPLGITLLLKHYHIATAGKHCVVLGRSNIVGLPMSILMGLNTTIGNATVTLCHSKTTELSKYTQQADILICAVGSPEFVTADMVKDGVVVVDVGISRVETHNPDKHYVLKGDVHFESVAPKSSYISPVPKGVGPMTVVALLSNTFKAFKQQVLGY